MKNTSFQTAARIMLATALLAPALAAAQYPERPIKLVVAAAAGGAADLLARQYTEKLKDQMGQPFVIENKPGATGAIGSDAVVKAQPDGYTLLLNSSSIVINPWVVKQQFNFQRDLTPIIRTAETPYIITVGAKVPIQNLEQLIAFAKKNPRKLECATYGIGSPPHLALELLKQAAGVDILHVPYKSFQQALPDLMSGQLACSIDPPTLPDAHVKAGTLRAVASTGVEPMHMYPHADPVGKRYPGATVVGWQAIFAPAATPRPVLDRLRAEWAKTLALPEIRQKLKDAGFEVPNPSIDDFQKTIASDYERFGKAVQAIGIKPE